MLVSESEPTDAALLKAWIVENGGTFHPHARFLEGNRMIRYVVQIEVANFWTIGSEVPEGLAVIANADLASDTTIVTCPFTLAITEDFAQKSLLNFLDLADVIAAKGWTERQWIASYLCFHWIDGDSSSSRCLYFSMLHKPTA
jgi:hypothetical protein